jgi:thymidine kinase
MRKPHEYRNLSNDALEELFSNFLIESWSYSKVSSFARNEKAFEMNYVYRCESKRSSASIGGNAYHEALEVYFTAVMKKETKDLVDLQKVAFDYIEKVDVTQWKLQKTTPTIEECKKKAIKITTSLLENFFGELDVYDFKEIIAVESRFSEFLTINGVDMPLPCHGVVDLIALTHDDKLVIVDHKSKASFSDEQAVVFSMGKQAVTYLHGIETKADVSIDEVWFIENKHSKNRNKSAQLNCSKITMDEDTIKLYDSLLYEPLKRMIEAVATPDYIYLINEDDNFVDKAELHLFWTQTLIAEVDDFNIPISKRELISKRLKKIRDVTIASINPNVIRKFRKHASQFIKYNLQNKDMSKNERIEHTLRTLGIIVNVAHKFEGYSNDTFLLEVSAGTNIGSIYKYKLDIASALSVPSIRINKSLFIHEGKSYLSVESAKKREKDLLYDPKFLEGSKIPIGLDNFNNTVFWDLNNQSTPHVMVCGSTGSGKSVSIISTIEYAKLAGVKDIIIFDPKMEFNSYNEKDGVTVYNDIEDIEDKLEGLVVEMNDRVRLGQVSLKLVIFDEFADATASARSGNELKVYEEQLVGEYKNGNPKYKRVHVSTKKSLEQNLKMLLQKGRSSGYRIIASTQRASVKVITGDAKVNFPVQICFRVPKEIDSKVVLGESGAESLAGNGDGLISSPEYMDLVRFQAFYKK